VKRAVQPASDRGDIVLGWLTKLVVIVSIVGLIGFDLISLGQSRFQAADRATTAAGAAANTYATTKDLQQAYNAALETTLDGDTIETKTFSIAADGTVDLRLHHTATTLLLHRVPQLRKYADAVGEGTARPNN
jgi:hypothetical protein